MNSQDYTLHSGFITQKNPTKPAAPAAAIADGPQNIHPVHPAHNLHPFPIGEILGFMAFPPYVYSRLCYRVTKLYISFTTFT